MKKITKFLAILLIATFSFSNSYAFKIIIWEWKNNILITQNNKIATFEEIFSVYADIFAKDIPESYKYIDLKFKNIEKNSKIYNALQKLVYKNLIPNSNIKIFPKAKLKKKIFYNIANKFAKRKVFSLNREINYNDYTTFKDISNLRITAKKENLWIVNISGDELFNKKVKRLYDVYHTIKTKHYDSKKINEEKMLDTAIEGLVIWTWDKFTAYFPPQENKNFQASLNWKFEWIWAYVLMPSPWLFKIISPLSGSPALKAWLKPWDIVLEVDWKKITKENSIWEVISWIKWPAWTIVNLKIKRWKKILNIKVKRAKIVIKNVEYKKLNSDTFYIKLNFFWEDVFKDFKKSIIALKKEKNIKKVILDLRNNPGWYLDKVADILSYFVAKGEKTVVVKEKKSQYSYRSYWYNDFDFSWVKIIILQNSWTASASEIMIWTIKDYFPKAIIIWEQSYWKGSVQTIKEYNDWSSLKYTIAKWFTWKTEKWIDHIWISPDIKMKDESTKFNENLKNDKLIKKALEL